jgi:hypothetical protein
MVLNYTARMRLKSLFTNVEQPLNISNQQFRFETLMKASRAEGTLIICTKLVLTADLTSCQ